MGAAAVVGTTMLLSFDPALAQQRAGLQLEEVPVCQLTFVF
jgi:hypothetical protein